MQTRTANSPAHGMWRHHLIRLLAASCAMLALAGASASASPTPVTTYRVVPLSPSGSLPDINAKGQVAFTAHEGGIHRAKFYDGTTVYDLGNFGGPGSLANALNDHGQVVGYAFTPEEGTFHAFRWSRRTGLIDLNVPGGGISSAYDINNRGEVVGAARFPGAGWRFHAFRWTRATGMVDIGTLGNESRASAVNDAGTAVGSTELPDSGGILSIAAKWPRGSGPIALDVSQSVYSGAFDINNAGQIVGSATFGAYPYDQAFIWTREGGIQDMGTAPAYLSIARRINEKGLAIGTLYSTPTDSNGFIWSRDKGLLVIGTPIEDRSNATDVNNRGQVVGYVNDRAFVWTRAGGFVDLNTRLVGAPADLVLYSAEAISDNGTIVAGANTGGLVLLLPQSGYHQPPVAGPVQFTGTARVGALLSFSVAFKDVDLRETHKAVWSWATAAGRSAPSAKPTVPAASAASTPTARTVSIRCA